MAPQVGGAHALSVEPHARPLPQPVREPGQVAVTVQVVGMQSTKWRARGLKQKKNTKKTTHTHKTEIVISKLGKIFSNNI